MILDPYGTDDHPHFRAKNGPPQTLKDVSYVDLKMSTISAGGID